MKKIELNVHLDGSLNITMMNQLLNTETRHDIIGKNSNSLTDYLSKFDLPIKVLQTRENIINFTKKFVEDLVLDEVIYAEVHFCPLLHTSILTPDEVVEAVLEGLNSNENIKIGLVLCLMRNFNLNRNLEIVRLYKKYKDQGVVGLNLSGDESRYKTISFKQLFEIINLDNIPFSISAGEADTYESVDLAIEFNAKRITHGIHSVESKSTVKKLTKNNITLDLSVSNELDTKCVETMDEYPIKYLLDQGVKITINTANRTTSNTTLENEYQILKENFKITNSQFLEFNLNAIEASFLEDEEKAQLKKELKKK